MLSMQHKKDIKQTKLLFANILLQNFNKIINELITACVKTLRPRNKNAF